MSSSASIEAQTLTTAASPGWASACSSAKASPSSTAGASGWITRPGPQATAQTVPAGTIVAARPSTWHFPLEPKPGLRPRRHWAEKASGKPSRPTGKLKGLVLVIEDDPDILSTVGDILEFEGYEVERATNGEEGLAALQRVQPALVLLDMRMPVLDGWEFARIMKEQGLQVPILVMTAARDARRWAQEIGAQGYISKPFHLPDLVAAVEKTMQSK